MYIYIYIQTPCCQALLPRATVACLKTCANRMEAHCVYNTIRMFPRVYPDARQGTPLSAQTGPCSPCGLYYYKYIYECVYTYIYI